MVGAGQPARRAGGRRPARRSRREKGRRGLKGNGRSRRLEAAARPRGKDLRAVGGNAPGGGARGGDLPPGSVGGQGGSGAGASPPGGSGGPGGPGGGGDPGLFRLLSDVSSELGVPREAVERDYAAGYLLASLSGHPRLKDALALKGGAALKKLYFGDDYRFSEDLDFSSLGPTAPRGEALEGAMREAARTAEERLGGRGAGFEVSVERYTEKRQHPGGQEAFTFRFRFPWQRRPVRPLKVEVTQDELVLSPTDPRPLSHRYPEPNPRTPSGAEVRSYSAEEVVAEKLLALLSTRDALRARGWTNGRSARDYYDLSRMAERYGPTLDLPAVRRLYAGKAERRGLPQHDPPGEDAFFAEDLLADTDNQWERRLGPVVPGGAPDRERTTAAVRRLVGDIFG